MNELRGDWECQPTGSLLVNLLTAEETNTALSSSPDGRVWTHAVWGTLGSTNREQPLTHSIPAPKLSFQYPYSRDCRDPSCLSRAVTDTQLYFVLPWRAWLHLKQGENRLRTANPSCSSFPRGGRSQGPHSPSSALTCSPIVTAQSTVGPLLPISLLWDHIRRDATFSHSEALVRDGKGQLVQPLKLNSF